MQHITVFTSKLTFNLICSCCQRPARKFFFLAINNPLTESLLGNFHLRNYPDPYGTRTRLDPLP